MDDTREELLPQYDAEPASAEGKSIYDLYVDSFSSVSGLILTGSLAVFLVLMYIVVLLHPLPVFMLHPLAQTLAFVLIVQGAAFLQPTRYNEHTDRGHAIHKWSLIVGLVPLIFGALVMYIFKNMNGKPHFTSWHGLLGLTTVIMFLVQGLFGASLIVPPLFNVHGGFEGARGLWKWHRTVGYAALSLMAFTIFLALWEVWLIGNSPLVVRWVMGAALITSIAALVSRISTSKLPL